MKELFTKAIDILYLAEQNDVKIILNGDRLQLQVPENATVDPLLIDEIRENKEAIIAFLKQDSWNAKTNIEGSGKITSFDRNIVTNIPVSFSQERLWFIDRLQGSLQYHLSEVLLLNGSLDINALENTFKTIVNRHEVLRTVIREKEGVAYQEIKAVDGWHLGCDLSGTYLNGTEELKERISSLIEKPFDLAADDMLRADVIWLENGTHILVITMHHIAGDAWSMPILVQEIAALYKAYSKNEILELPALPLQFADFALWQRNPLHEQQLESKLEYWKQKLADVQQLQLPADSIRSSGAVVNGSTLTFNIGNDLTSALHKLSQRNGATLYMTLLTAFKVLLHRYSDQEDICVGTSIAGRPQQELEHLIGFFVNTLALRDQVSGQATFNQLLAQVKQTVLDAFTHQDVPFERVVEATVKEREAGVSPLFQVMLVLGNTPEIPAITLGNLELSGYGIEHKTVKFDLTFFVTETKYGLKWAVQYNTDLYNTARIRRMVRHFETLLISIVSNPDMKVGKLRLLNRKEELWLVKNERSHCAYIANETIIELFLAQALQNPDLKAVTFEGKSLTYRELHVRSNRLAHHLQRYGVKADVLVPVYMERGMDMIVAILGILKSGGAYVPIDTDFPSDRVKHILDDTRAGVIVSSSKFADRALAITEYQKVLELDNMDWELSLEPENDPELFPSSSHLAYVIYTSGSTGKPKGVLIDHDSLLDYVYGLNERTGISECETFGLMSTIATDLGNTVLFSSLAYGGTLHVFSKETVSNVHQIHNYFGQHQIDCIKIVPSHWKALSPDTDVPLLPAKLLIFGGEALPKETVTRIARYSACRVINHYGPTETTIGKLLYEATDKLIEGARVPVGRPFSNTIVYVLGKEMERCPIGIPGELYIGGRGLAQGYHRLPKLTNEKFIADPYRREGSRIYRTGDRVVMRADGNIEYLGRMDDQVKIRGYRVEPGEIALVLEHSKHVNQAAVIAIDDKLGNKQLVAYIVPSAKFDPVDLNIYLKEHLPDYMLPSHLIQLSAIPLTANGKIDRKALPHPEVQASGKEFTAPRNKVESKLSEIWQNILEIEEIGINDNFFELGGHSLLAVKLISEVRKAFEQDLSIGEVFDYPTIGSLSSRLGRAEQNISAGIIAGPRPELIPLSYSQERLWFIDRMSGSVQYHVPAVFNLSGTLNIDALQNTFRAIVNRHEILRTVIFEQDGQGYQHVKLANTWELKQTDAKEYEDQHLALEQYIRLQVAQPFDLSKDDMLRAELIKVNENESTLVLTMHHIASDGSSSAILVKEWLELYNAFSTNREPVLPVLAVQYPDYAIWQRTNLQGDLLTTKLAYWQRKLAGVITLQLPADRQRPAEQSTNGALYEFAISEDVTKGLHALSVQNGVSLYMTLLSAFNVLLYRYSGQEDLCVGSPIANRNQPEIADLIGFFVNTLAIRSHLGAEMSFTALLAQVKQTMLEAYEHQDVPFEKVVEAVVKERDLSRSPLFQVMFVLQNTARIPELQLGDLTLQQTQDAHQTAKFDITLFVIESENGLRAGLEYNTDLYNELTINGMAGHYSQLLNAVVDTPNELVSRLNMIGEAESKQLEIFNATRADYTGEGNVISLFEEQVTKNPDAIALVFENEELSYRVLNERSNQLARYLQKQGVTNETLVPVCIERGLGMIISILGILKAGGVYVPVDPDFPQERIDYMVADTGALVLVSSIQSSKRILSSVTLVIEIDGKQEQDIANESKASLDINIDAEQLIYILYTSGSTGKPKGVMMPERAMFNLLNWQETQFKNKNRRVLQFAAYTFDVSFQEIFSTLCFGNTLCLIDGDTRRDMNALIDHIVKYELTHLFFPVVVLQNLAEQIISDPKISLLVEEIIVAGEQLKITDEVRTLIRSADIKVINQYGPTEAHVVSSFTVDSSTISVLPPIGAPVSNTQIYIRSASGELSPLGVPGEICIGGVQVARGYLNQPELTKEKFIADAYSEEPNAKLYRTGDQGRWLADGNIEYLGRIDDQVKIRGYRIEPGEIEQVLLQHENVRQAVALAKADKQGTKRLTAYVVMDETAYDKQELQNYLGERLPEYMVPRLWVNLQSLPLTPNGKTDKKALPEVETSHEESYTAPQTATEKQLAKIWEELLGVEKVGTKDNFFELGGHSLLAMRVISQVRKELNKELKIRDLFMYPVIADLAKQLEGEDSQAADSTIKSINPRPEYIPLSYSQERLWFINRLEGSVQYHIPAVLKLDGEVNIVALENALKAIVERHEVLRTVIREHEGLGYQYIKASDWTLKQSQSSNQADLKSYISKEVSKPFDLSQDDMLRAELIATGASEYVLLLVLHHIAADGWSMPVLVSEFSSLYSSFSSNQTSTLKTPAIQYADYAIWQREYLDAAKLQSKLNYWEEKLTGTTTLELPTDHMRPAVQSSKGSVYEFTINKEVAEKLQKLSLEQGATLYMTLLSVFKVLLYRYSGQEDICVGTPVANRDREEIAELIGFFVNTLALRTNLNGEEAFTKLLSKVKQTTLEAYGHQDVPFEKVVEAVVIERDLSRSPLFQVMFVLQNTAVIPTLELGDIKITGERAGDQASKYDLSYNAEETKDGIRFVVEYNTDLYEAETIARMADHYAELIASVTKEPATRINKLQLLSKTEEEELSTFNETTAEYPKEENIISLFEAQAKATPTATALVFEGETVSYNALNEQANKIAHYLQEQGVTKETPIAICIERCTAMIAGILGVLKAGAAYVPVDIEYPRDRISYILEDTKATIVLSSSTGKANLEKANVIELDNNEEIANQSSDNLSITIGPNQLAYIMYTSGSTGKPKGVMVEHQNIINYTLGFANYFGITAADTVLQQSSVSFDTMCEEVYPALISGAKVVMVKEGGKDVDDIIRLISKESITILSATPTVIAYLNKEAGNNNINTKSLRYIISGGELLQPGFIDNLYPTVTVVNSYGPTEGTVCATYYTIGDINKAALIGKPVSNTKIRIRNQSGELSPVGVLGEICIGGVQVARGYLNQPELTKEKFITDPYSEGPNARLYRTGDQGRWLADGNIEYLGRIDDQVKIRGYRIEPGEIEQVLLQHENIKQAVVLARADKQGTKRLTAYVVMDETAYDKQELQNYLGERLPEYMVPRLWVRLDSLPLTPNGKTDKRALPEAETSHEESYTAPQTTTEKQLAKIWEELLGVEKVGTKDNFFELGGHSLLAMRVISQVRKELNKELKIRDLFMYPVIADLAKQLEGEGLETADSTIKSINPRPEYIPLSYSQERLWFIDRLEGSVQYHIPAVLKLEGEVNIVALKNALKAIVDRHEVLRTVIREHEGLGYQYIKASDWTLKQSQSSNQADLKSYISKEVSKPFDLSQDDMLRAELIATGATEYVLLLVLHHIAADGWSMPVLVSEFSSLYSSFSSNQTSTLKTPAIQYADYAIWQREYLDAAKLQSKLNYWEEKLTGTTTLELPTDHMRPAVQSSKGSVYEFTINKEVAEKLQKLSLEQGATLYMTLLSVFKVLLYRYSGQEDICVGTPVANRDREEIAELIGFFVNTLALRTNLNGEEAFTKLLSKVKQTTLEAYGHQDVPFEKVVEAVVIERDLSRSPLFQVMFVLQNTAVIPTLELGDIKITGERAGDQASKYDLSYNAEETKDGIRFVVEYNTDLYEAETIARMADHYAELIASVTKEPATRINKLQLLSKTEEEELSTFNETTAEYPKTENIISLFEAQAKATPDATALVFEGETVSYQALNEQSNKIANYLKEQGIKKESLVAICIERGTAMIAGILGILKAGAAYVPVDIEYPKDRIGFILNDTKAGIVLSSSTGKANLRHSNIQVVELNNNQEIANQSGDNLNITIDPNQLAYVIYTSGSTGKPKGVMVEHGNLINYLVNNKTQYISGSNNQSGTFIHLSYTFDASVTGLFMPLISGRSIIIASTKYDNVFEDANLLKYAPYEFIKITPAHISLLKEATSIQDRNNLADRLVIGGEALRLNHFDGYHTGGCNTEVINEYGPTEATVGCSVYSFNLSDNLETIPSGIPIGKPISNTTLYILNEQGDQQPIGVKGELYIGGEGVARGYLNNADLTAQKFIKDPINKSGRLYRTGDTARWLADGNLEYLGRADDQVKVRGYRIEPGEIENVLLQNPEVTQAVVLARPDNQGAKRLTAYVVMNENAYNKQQLQQYLQERLPEYMVPRLWVRMESLPLTVSGKIDKKALPEAEISGVISDTYVSPRNQTEEQLIQIWQELLNLDRIGIYDNFFELGGDSILTIQVVSRARKYGIEIQPKDIFYHQVIARLAEAVQKNGGNKIQTEQGVLSGEAGLVPVQQWYLDRNETEISHYNQAVLLAIDKNISAATLQKCFDVLVSYHDALTFKYTNLSGIWKQHYGTARVEVLVEDLTNVQDLHAGISASTNEYQRSLSITEGRLISVVLMKTPDSETANRLSIVVHHLAVDGVSLRIILNDLNTLLDNIAAGEEPNLGAKGSSYRQWHQALTQYGESKRLLAQEKYWEQIILSYNALPVDTAFNGKAKMSDMTNIRVKLSAGYTAQLLREVPKVYHTEINDLLLAALANTLCGWVEKQEVVIGLEGHGREPITDEVDISRTMGWFTSLYPVKLRAEADADKLIKEVKEDLRKVADKGLGFGVLKYINKADGLQGNDPWDIMFNYLGQFDQAVTAGNWFNYANENNGEAVNKMQFSPVKITINSYIIAGELIVNWSFSNKHYIEKTINDLSLNYITCLSQLIDHCLEQAKSKIVFTPADYGLGAEINYQELDRFLDDNDTDNIMSF
ncbi:amino acid adenylation domain-containing protein [Mucilaginibacter sp. SMC90]|uniref:non-ribosomal peptide synthetase n=1 Tax=Mucilaginibacter sp. SMC90 TaxID=2929803 RepID=UPI001FB2774A|nr:non-ribosomal peptide synthetase [Mucilaginibacter sp. SMC90]UOE51897.1 amino acid adenylation domain-containing protein [Mucilaginibacter sp. SMC90]